MHKKTGPAGPCFKLSFWKESALHSADLVDILRKLMQIILQDVDAVRFFRNSFYDILRKASAGRSTATAAVEAGLLSCE